MGGMREADTAMVLAAADSSSSSFSFPFSLSANKIYDEMLRKRVTHPRRWAVSLGEDPSFTEACFHQHPIYTFQEHVLSFHCDLVLEPGELVSSEGNNTFSSVWPFWNASCMLRRLEVVPELTQTRLLACIYWRGYEEGSGASDLS